MVNRIGIVYGYLTVIEKVPDPERKVSLWLCSCKCGSKVVVKGGNLNSGNTKSCGCLDLEKKIERTTKHGMSGTSQYITYYKMISRCTNVDDPAFPDYGGRGIKVCDRWLTSFENFFQDVGIRPSKKHTLDRVDNDGDYGPHNFRWATKKEQAENRRSNKWYEYNGLKMIQKDWSRYLKVDNRLFNKWVVKKGFEIAYLYFNKK